MNDLDIVSHTTALKLREIGFPQPEAKPGQYWYRKNPRSKAITTEFVQGVEDTGAYMLWIGSEDTGGGFYHLDQPKLGFVFAPGIKDLLQEIPGLSVYYCGMNLWNTNNPFEGSFDCDFVPLDNPAEAAARFYITVKEENTKRIKAMRSE